MTNDTSGHLTMSGAGSEPIVGRDADPWYRDDDVTVSRRWLEVSGHRYPVAELRGIRTATAGYGGLAVNSILVTVALALVIARVWDRLDLAGWIGALVVLAVPTVLTAVGIRRRQRGHVLLADWRGRPTPLVVDASRTRLDRIARAVVRAQQAQRG